MLPSSKFVWFILLNEDESFDLDFDSELSQEMEELNTALVE